MKKIFSFLIVLVMILTASVSVCAIDLPIINIGGEDEIDNPFTDVVNEDWFYDSVLWAVDNKITNGMTATLFAPQSKCTRAQIVTFLWNYSGKPSLDEGVVNKFKDVKSSDWFYTAVMWAVQNGITSGKTATSFAPNDTCTRGEAMCFIYRMINPGDTDYSPSSAFTDIKKKDFYYYPVCWANAVGISHGMTSTTFGPNSKCNRAQIVTFLYNYENVRDITESRVFSMGIDSNNKIINQANATDTITQVRGKIVTDSGISRKVFQTDDGINGSAGEKNTNAYFQTAEYSNANGITVEMYVKFDYHWYYAQHGLFTTTGEFSLQRAKESFAMAGIASCSSAGNDYYDDTKENLRYMPLEQWLHVVITESTDGTQIIYVDGEIINSGNYGHEDDTFGFLFGNISPWYLKNAGCASVTNIAAANIYNRVLNADEISSLYTSYSK